MAKPQSRSLVRPGPAPNQTQLQMPWPPYTPTPPHRRHLSLCRAHQPPGAPQQAWRGAGAGRAGREPRGRRRRAWKTLHGCRPAGGRRREFRRGPRGGRRTRRLCSRRPSWNQWIGAAELILQAAPGVRVGLGTLGRPAWGSGLSFPACPAGRVSATMGHRGGATCRQVTPCLLDGSGRVGMGTPKSGGK